MNTYESQFRKLTDVGSVNRGKSKHRPRNAPELYGGKYPFIQTGDVKHANFFITEYKQTYNNKGLAQSKLWQPDTLCITIAANIADTAILKIPACFPDSIIGFIAKKGVSNVRFVKYCLDTYKKEMRSISQGTTQDNLSQSKLLSLSFRIPDYEQQLKVASILSAYDDLIETNQRRIALLEKMAEEIYREWFVRLRFPEHQYVKFEKGLPADWDIKRVKEIVDRNKFGRLYYEHELAEDGNIVVIDQSRADCLGYYDGDPQHIATANSPIILFGDHSCKMVLMTKPFSLAENVIPFKPKPMVSTYFLFHLVKDLTRTVEYKRHWTDLTHNEVLVPPETLQLEFDKIVKSNHEQIELLRQSIRKTQKIRDLLLPRLISGKLLVEHLDIQFPPSMLDEAANLEVQRTMS